MLHIDGLVQERHNSIANALELRLSCTNPLICIIFSHWQRPWSATDRKQAQVLLSSVAADAQAPKSKSVIHSTSSGCWVAHWFRLWWSHCIITTLKTGHFDKYIWTVNSMASAKNISLQWLTRILALQIYWDVFLWNLLIINQQSAWIRWWIVAFRQQSITW